MQHNLLVKPVGMKSLIVAKQLKQSQLLKPKVQKININNSLKYADRDVIVC